MNGAIKMPFPHYSGIEALTHWTVSSLLALHRSTEGPLSKCLPVEGSFKRTIYLLVLD